VGRTLLEPVRPGLGRGRRCGGRRGALPEGPCSSSRVSTRPANTQPNGASHTPNSIFNDTAKTGFYNSTDLQRTRASQGVYRSQDPWERQPVRHSDRRLDAVSASLHARLRLPPLERRRHHRHAAIKAQTGAVLRQSDRLPFARRAPQPAASDAYDDRPRLQDDEPAARRHAENPDRVLLSLHSQPLASRSTRGEHIPVPSTTGGRRLPDRCPDRHREPGGSGIKKKTRSRRRC